MLIRLWMLVILASIISYLVLRFGLKKNIHFAWIFLFWIVVVLGATTMLYGISVWLVSQE